MGTIELGIDEAGRGPVLGPLVLAGVWVPEDKTRLLEEWGVKDSKLFGSPAKARIKRKALSEKIKSEFHYHVTVLSSKTVDSYVIDGGLNRLEQQTALEILKKYPADRIVLDGQNLFKPLVNHKTLAVNKADAQFASVAAASIVAKVTRDEAFEALCLNFHQEFGPVQGNGYANPKTLAFVKWHIETRGNFPDFYRRSFRWKALD